MSVSVDRKYLLLVSSNLERFTQKNVDLFNFRCPICGDSEKSKIKSRGYIYRKGDDYFYTCKNCGAGHNFYNFLEIVNPSLLSEYKMESFKENRFGNRQYYKPKVEEYKPKSVPKFNIPTIKSLSDEHFAKKYVMGRKIPEKYYDDLFYADDFKSFVESLNLDQEFTFKEDDKRLIIPFYNSKKEITYLQGRALSSDNKIRYITITIDKRYPKIFGLDRLNQNKKIYVFEGPIDSMFIENSIATADANLTKSDVVNGNKVLVFDNQPRNKQLAKIIKDSIDDNHKVCLLPETDGKDINEMILSGMQPEQIKEMIDKHTFEGLSAQMEYTRWRKV